MSFRSKRLMVVGFVVTAAFALWAGLDHSGRQSNDEFAAIDQTGANGLARIGFNSSWADTLAELNLVASLKPSTFEGEALSLETHAAEAAIAALFVSFDTASSVIDLAGKPVMADRVAIGLNQLGLRFERSVDPDPFGNYGTQISVGGPQQALGVPPVDQASAGARLAAIVELSGSVDGRLTTAAGADEVERLAAYLDLRTRHVGTDLWIEDASMVEFLARQVFVDPTPIPIIGNNRDTPNQFAGFEQLIPNDGSDSAWKRGTTGSLLWYLDPANVPELPTGGVNVGWNNGEAQRYVPRNVSFDEDGLTIVTRTVRSPDVENLPFTSGLVMTNSAYGWGSTTVEVQLPEGPGMWPAIWLLDAGACEAPGRCSGYGTSAYHEIDLIETRTQEPEVAHLSVHWGIDGRTVSDSATAEIETLSISQRSVVVELERRPGLLLWRLDGAVVHVVGGEVTDFETGPHRSAPMHLIINTAVGGTFAGAELVGRDGQWWGDARVPAGFDNPEWSRAEMTVKGLTFLGLGVTG